MTLLSVSGSMPLMRLYFMIFGQGCKSSEGFTGAGGSTRKVEHTHMAGKLELVVCRRLHLLPRGASF